MGLKLTLKKQDNVLYNDFINAYWKLTNINYTTSVVAFELSCFPTREASKMNLISMPAPTLPMGGANRIIYETSLYSWQSYEAITNIFPSGIPLSEDEQKTAIYNWVKKYTRLPFEDVFEE